MAVAVATVGWFYHHAAYSLALGSQADVARYWVMCQYVTAGENPYPITRRILLEEVGPADKLKARMVLIPQPKSPETLALVIESLGPPEATYAPSSLGMLTVLLGWLPTEKAAVLWWIALEAAAHVAFAWLLSGWLAAPCRLSRATNAAAIAALMLAFSPFAASVRSAQFSVVGALCILVATRPKTPSWLAGLALAIGLTKPTTAIPFVLWELARGRWRSVAVAAAIHLVLMALVCLLIKADPVAVHRDWMAITPYFMAGMYSVQEAVEILHLHGTPQATALQVGVLFGIVVVCVVGRRTGWAAGCAFLCAANLVWVYHRSYDFVTLLLPLLLLLGWRDARPEGEPSPAAAWWSILIGAGCFAFISAGALQAVISSDDGWDRVIRWGCRFALVYILAVTAFWTCAGGVRVRLRR